MKKIILFGDSIRLGYENYIKDSLEGIAEVYKAKDTCAFSQYMLRWVNEWKLKEGYPDDVDLVHWNVGLWDVLRLFGEDTFTTPEYYEEALKRIVRQMQKFFPNAKLVFATSTAVIEKGYKDKDFCRFNSDIEKFNEIAVRTLRPLGVGINDLYEITKGIPESYHSDMTHFRTKEGTKIIGDRILQVICKNLDISAMEIRVGDFELPDIPDSILGV